MTDKPKSITHDQHRVGLWAMADCLYPGWRANPSRDVRINIVCKMEDVVAAYFIKQSSELKAIANNALAHNPGYLDPEDYKSE